ncbi:hypothetical protein M8697_001546 [Providencia rettgeri]|nr:hypothetical protein [Providencia rettgeri]
MRKYISILLLFLSLNSNATQSLEAINKLTDRLCGNRYDKSQCEEAINTIISLSIYYGYSSGACNTESGSYNQFNSECNKAKEEMQNILKKTKTK